MPPLVIGGGPAGSAAAIMLARGGTGATVLERTREPGDALCGGFLSWRTLETLARLGIDADALNPQPVTQLRLFAGDRTVTAALPSPARGVSRRRLDSLMLARAEAEGARIECGIAVRALEGGVARLADSSEVASDHILLATGKHDLRGAARPANARGADPSLGLRIRLGPSPALDRLLAQTIELHLFDRGYAGLVAQEDGRINLCMAVHRSRLDAAGSAAALLEQLGAVHPALGERLAYAVEEAAIDAVANVPYGWRARATEPGVYRLGDQAAVIPSLAGEGMGIAVASGIAAASALLRREDAERYQRRFARSVARPMRVAGVVRALAESQHAGAMLLSVARLAPSLVGAVAHLTRISTLAVDDDAR
jgi:flavin-dependent dehydrogenase